MDAEARKDSAFLGETVSSQFAGRTPKDGQGWIQTGLTTKVRPKESDPIQP